MPERSIVSSMWRSAATTDGALGSSAAIENSFTVWRTRRLRRAAASTLNCCATIASTPRREADHALDAGKAVFEAVCVFKGADRRFNAVLLDRCRVLRLPHERSCRVRLAVSSCIKWLPTLLVAPVTRITAIDRRTSRLRLPRSLREGHLADAAQAPICDRRGQ